MGTSTIPTSLVIKQQGDLPVGCLPNDYNHHMKLNNARIIMRDESVRGSDAIIWTLRILPHAKPLVLKAGDCLVAGAAVAGYQQEGMLKWKSGVL